MLLDDAASSDSDSADYHLQIALLTERVANPNPWEYMDETTVPTAYDSSLYNIRLNAHLPSQRACRRILSKHRRFIQRLVDPLFSDIHTLVFEARIRENSPPFSRESTLPRKISTISMHPSTPFRTF
jgi:hypothetical protein